MSGGRGLIAAVAAAAAAAFTAAPAAQAAEGTDISNRTEQVQYTADPGEVNHLTLDNANADLHMHDSGAIIRWLPSDSVPECTAAGQDVFCSDRLGIGFSVFASLGDGNDTFVNNSTSAAYVDLGPGDDKASGGSHGYKFVGGPGADDFHGANVVSVDPWVGLGVDYSSSAGPVTVTADDVANDGLSGEHDNVHSDVAEVDGSRLGNHITGFHREFGGAGNDMLIGTSGDDLLFAGGGTDVFVGGAGSDTLWATDGNNTFYARDGAADRIICGSGHDTVYADPQDTLDQTSGACDDVHIG
jgi:Ca2+-binding RTX toxin-like protein